MSLHMPHNDTDNDTKRSSLLLWLSTLIGRGIGISEASNPGVILHVLRYYYPELCDIHGVRDDDDVTYVHGVVSIARCCMHMGLAVDANSLMEEDTEQTMKILSLLHTNSRDVSINKHKLVCDDDDRNDI